MNAKIIPIIVLLPVFFTLFTSCEDTTYKEYRGYAPVYMSYEELRGSVSEVAGTDLENPGKIYFKDNYIFIVEELKGIHVFDNTDPSSPVKKAFVKLPGVVDISISGYIMYADSYIDLVVLDVENIDNIHEVGRIKDILPYTVPASDSDFPKGYIDKDKGVVIGWELGIVREKVNFNPDRYPYPVFFSSATAYLTDLNSAGASSGVSGGGVGIGGSMARFGIKGKVLYLVDQNTLKVFDITNKTAPSKLSDINPGWGIETMFLTENTMFLGTNTGMVVFDITNPTSPVSKSFFRHARSCDPVIVDDTLAYITLRSGTNCGGVQNCLDVVNIKDINVPVAVKSYPLVNPHGLGKDGDLLFVCDGNAGLKVYDASDPLKITANMIYAYPGLKAFDVIPIGNTLVMIGDDGLYQYDYSNIQNISLLSTIPVVRN